LGKKLNDDDEDDNNNKRRILRSCCRLPLTRRRRRARFSASEDDDLDLDGSTSARRTSPACYTTLDTSTTNVVRVFFVEPILSHVTSSVRNFSKKLICGSSLSIFGAKVDGFSRLIDASSQSFQTPAGELFRERKKLENFVG
jgi:hypothetical protein